MLSADQIFYFDNLEIGKVVALSDARDPEAFKLAAIYYIDHCPNGYTLEFSNDYKSIRKLNKIQSL